jgi:ribonuclease D
MTVGGEVSAHIEAKHAVGEERARALDAITSAERIALDTEFHAERGYTPELCLVQVHVEGKGIWLFDPLRDPDFDSIGPILCAKPWLVHAGRQDVHILARRWKARPPQVLDVQIAAGLVTRDYPLGYGALLERWLDVSVDKGLALSDWTRRPLHKDQVSYAVADVAYLPALWDALSKDLDRTNRGVAFEGCCAEALGRWSEAPSVEHRWQNLDAKDRLPPEVQTVLWALFEWREQEGLRLDRSPNRVLSDGLAIRLARWKPTSLKTLGRDRRMPQGLVRRHGEALVRVVRESVDAFDTSSCELRPLSAEEAWRRDWLELLAKGLGDMLDASPTLLLPYEVRRAWILRPPGSRGEVETPLTSWRRDILGELLWYSWSGERCLTSSGLTNHP